MVMYSPQYGAAISVKVFLILLSKRYAAFSKKEHWRNICDYFDNRCAYCGKRTDLQAEHLVGWNKDECGLHHPGNIVPVCSKCNQDKSASRMAWDKFLKSIAGESYRPRRRRIRTHMKHYQYPALTKEWHDRVTSSANKLYEFVVSAVLDAERECP